MTQASDFDATKIDFDTILNSIPSINMGARSANAPLTQSYDKGPDVPLIEATIGDFLMRLYPNIQSAKLWFLAIKISAGPTENSNSKSISWPVV